MTIKTLVTAIFLFQIMLILGCQNEESIQNENNTNFSEIAETNLSDIIVENTSIGYPGFISGKVVGSRNVSVIVQAMQNLAWTAETTTDAEGNYNLTGLKSGKYGLLFVAGRTAYVYNDAINNDWSQNLKETISPNSSGVNIDLATERPDFEPTKILVWFKVNVSLLDVVKILRNHNSSIYRVNSDSVTILIPNHRTALEVINELKADGNVEAANPNRILFAESMVTSEDKNYCEKDEDCVPISCCHPSSTVNINYGPDCGEGGGCTAVCSGPLDCGCGKPACMNNECGIEKLSDASWCPGPHIINDTLKEGEYKTYNLAGKDYEVVPYEIRDETTVKMGINGQSFELMEGENYTLTDGSIFILYDINSTSVSFNFWMD